MEISVFYSVIHVYVNGKSPIHTCILVALSLSLSPRTMPVISCFILVQEFKNLWPQLDIVFDGGELGDTFHSRAGSTVVDLSVQGTYKIIREGR